MSSWLAVGGYNGCYDTSHGSWGPSLPRSAKLHNMEGIQRDGIGVQMMIFLLDVVPSGYIKIAIENTPFAIDLPIQNGDFL